MQSVSKNNDWINNFIKDSLHFHPSCDNDNFLPFAINRPFSVYGISDMTDEQIDLLYEVAPNAIQNCLVPGYKIYSVDWNHKTVLYDPLDPDSAEYDCYTPPRFTKNGLAYFNEFFPNGDYYFFIDRFGAFGYLSHPWREEVWIFGKSLVNEFEKIYTQLGWKQKALLV